MEEQNTKIEETVDSIKEYFHTRYELTVLKASDKLAHIGSNIASFLPIIVLTVLTFVMLVFALALYLNTVYNSRYLGFLVTGGICFVIGFFLVCVRKRLMAKPFRNKIIREMFKNNNFEITGNNGK